jgi:uncharacterized cupredoxin-like copper-binding protein
MSSRRAVPTFVLLVIVALAGCSGAPASPSVPTRTIAVTTTDEMRYEPDAFEVAAGETVAFAITNAGQVPHEFYVGTPEDQVLHEREMATGHSMHDHANSVTVEPGQSKDLVLTFARAGTLEVGCHVPGHWDAGMRGTITVR